MFSGATTSSDLRSSSATTMSLGSASGLASGLGGVVSPSTSVLSDVMFQEDFVLSGSGGRKKTKQAGTNSSGANGRGRTSSISSVSHLALANGNDNDEGGDDNVEELAKEDPLATQVWRMYARTKAQLPHAQRMENLTWRMMALALRRKKQAEADEEARRAEDELRTNEDNGGAMGSKPASAAAYVESREEQRASANLQSQNREISSSFLLRVKSGTNSEHVADDERRGRAPGKGKAKMTIVGFGDGDDEDEEAE